VIALAAVAFLAFGVVLVLVGANQAELAAAYGLDLAGTGMLAAALSLGLGIGVAAAGPLVDRCPRRPLFVGAALLAAAALLAMGRQIGPWGAALALVCAGLGAGAYETLINTAVAEEAPLGAASRLSAVHAAATLGAVLGAPLLGFLARSGGFALGFHATGAALGALAVAGLAFPFAPPPRRPVSPTRGRRAGSGLLGAPLLALAAVGAVYVGFETAVTAFAVPWAHALALPRARGIAAISSFWLGLLLGRVLFALLRRPASPRLVAAAAGGAAVLLAVGVAARVESLELLVGGIGLLLGPVFPVLVALTAARFPDQRGTATGLVVAAGSAGGMGVPWITGVLGDGLGANTAVGSLAAWCALLAALGVAAGRARR
jgi:fucose permease